MKNTTVEVTNKQLLQYCAVFFNYFLKEYAKTSRYPRIDLYTKESNHVVMSLYPCTDKNRQGISIYEGAQDYTDEPIERVNTTNDSTYIVKPNTPDKWTVENAEKDLKKALETMKVAAEV